MPRILLIALLFVLLLVAGIGFTALNATPVSLDYFFGHWETLLPWVLLVAMLAGFLLGVVVTGFALLNLQRRNRRLRKELRSLEAEVTNLRNLPIRNANG